MVHSNTFMNIQDNSPLASPELQRVIIEHIQDGIFVIEDGHFTFCNSAFAEMLESTPQQVIGLSLTHVLSPEQSDSVMERYQRRVAGEDVSNFTEFDLIRLSDSKPVRVLCSIGLAKTDDGKILSVGTLKDISKMHQLALELQRSEDEHRDVINRFAATYYQTNAEGIFTYITPYCSEDLGYEPHELIGTDIKSYYYTPKDRDIILDAMANSEGNLTYVEARLKHKDGSIIWAATKAKYLYDKNNKFIGVEGTTRNITEEKHLQERLKDMAIHDQLTGLLNRFGLYAQMELAMSMAERNKSSLCLFFIDLDKFKLINDKYGHKAGDEVLVEVATRLKEHRRGMDIIARPGGDEFILLLENIGDKEHVTALAKRIHATVSRPYTSDIHINCSIGFSLFPEDGTTIDALINSADKRMYIEKKVTYASR
jgi:diguanylate cyclase (GGDEF)-like protein/PAS domain S-box-containing protein